MRLWCFQIIDLKPRSIGHHRKSIAIAVVHHHGSPEQTIVPISTPLGETYIVSEGVILIGLLGLGWLARIVPFHIDLIRLHN